MHIEAYYFRRIHAYIHTYMQTMPQLHVHFLLPRKSSSAKNGLHILSHWFKGNPLTPQNSQIISKSIGCFLQHDNILLFLRTMPKSLNTEKSIRCPIEASPFLNSIHDGYYQRKNVINLKLQQNLRLTRDSYLQDVQK